jgi:amino acid permease
MLLIIFMFITGIPYAFKQSGFILGTLLIVIVGVITGLCLYILVPSNIDISYSKYIFIVSRQFFFF